MEQENSEAVDENSEMTRGIMLSIGWLAATGVLLYVVLMLDLRWSLFGWSPELNRGTIIDAIYVVISLSAIWFLGKVSRDKVSCGVAVFACVTLAWFAIVLFPVESATQGLLLTCPQPSPLWFRVGRTLLLCMPGIFCFWRIRTYFIQQNGSAQNTDVILKNKIKKSLIWVMSITLAFEFAICAGYVLRKSYQLDKANKVFDPVKHSLSGIYLPWPLGKPSIFGQLDYESEKRIRAFVNCDQDLVQKEDMELIIHASDDSFFVHFK